MITVDFMAFGVAELNKGIWNTENKKFENILNQGIRTIDISGADPYPALTVAKELAKRFDGRVIAYDKTKPKNGVIY